MGHARIGQQQGDGVGGHRRGAAGVVGQLAGLAVLIDGGAPGGAFGQTGAFSRRQHPGGEGAAERAEDDVVVIAGPPGGPGPQAARAIDDGMGIRPPGGRVWKDVAVPAPVC